MRPCKCVLENVWVRKTKSPRAAVMLLPGGSPMYHFQSRCPTLGFVPKSMVETFGILEHLCTCREPANCTSTRISVRRRGYGD